MRFGIKYKGDTRSDTARIIAWSSGNVTQRPTLVGHTQNTIIRGCNISGENSIHFQRLRATLSYQIRRGVGGIVGGSRRGFIVC